VERVPPPALAPHLLHQGLDLDLQRGAGEVASGVAERRPRRLRQVVQGAIQQINVVSG
jgi:hypothetical protein